MPCLAAFVEMIWAVFWVIDRSHIGSYFMYDFMVAWLIFLGIFDIQVGMVGYSFLDFVILSVIMVGISRYDAIRIDFVFIFSHGINEAIEVWMKGWFSAGQGNSGPDFLFLSALFKEVLPLFKGYIFRSFSFAVLGSPVAVWAGSVADVGHVNLEMPHPWGIHFRFVLGYVNHSS